MKKCSFIKYKKKIYVPSPDSWLAGWARQRWLEKYFKDDNILTVGAERWAELASKNKVRVLIEENGKFSVEKK